MLAEFLLQVYNLKWFLLAVILLTTGGLVFFMLEGDYFDWTRKKVSTFGLLFDLDRRGCIALAESLSRLIYIVYVAINCTRTGLEAGIVILLMTVFGCIVTKDWKGIPQQVLTFGAVYGLLLLEGMFGNYYNDVERYWLLRAMVIFMGVFACLYTVYASIGYHERIIRISEVRQRNSFGEHVKLKDVMPRRPGFIQNRKDRKSSIIVNVQKKT